MLSSLKKLSAVDKLFALLRVIAIAGGVTWLFLTPLPSQQATRLFLTFGFFCFYSILLYTVILMKPDAIRTLYYFAFFLDLIFLFLLIRLTGGFQSDFLLAFLLLIALHSFYFGLHFGLFVAALASVTYLFAGGISAFPENWVVVALRIGFFFLTGAALGLLSRKETQDRERIEQLNRELVNERNKLSQILEGIDAGLILLDSERQILWMNRISESWFDASQEVCGRQCHEVIWKGERHCTECPTVRCLTSGKIETGELEYTFQGNGDVRYFRITSAPLPDENGNVERVLELFQDVTEEKELQLHLIQSSKLAAVGELASGTAHEINNPLSAIAVCVQEIAEALASPRSGNNKFDVDIRQNLDYIREEIQRCKRITTGLLNLARKSEHRKVPVDINQVLRNVVMLVRYKARKERKDIELKLTPNLPAVSGESDALSQVFLNLLLNAIEFTPAGPTIQIISGMQDEITLFVKIADQGFGISPQNLNKIFQPFFTTKPAGSGTGLGLPISQRIVKAHGGWIEVESQLNKGTTFTVYLPVGEG